VWYTLGNSDQIGTTTPSGSSTFFTVPTAYANPLNITVGPDGNLWFTESSAGQVGRITPSGTITEFNVEPPPGSTPYTYGAPEGITAADGDLWFTYYTQPYSTGAYNAGADDYIGRITTRAR